MHTASICTQLADIPAGHWNALHDGRNPFVTHAFLAGLEQHGCLRKAWGWTPQHLTLWQGDELVAAAPSYLKTNSHGEFVFDHAWAQAYAQHGLEYFPKWLFAVPYTPVTGPRLLARSDADRNALVHSIVERAVAANHQPTTHNLSSAHINFHTPAEESSFDERWLSRLDVQYHWRNDDGWRDFGDFLAVFDHKHRKNIRQERAKVQRAGVAFRVIHGDEASDDDIAMMHGFYLHTFRDYGNPPALTLDFFRHLARSMPRQWVLILAERSGETIAGALCLRGGDTLYGRYWGTSDTLDDSRISGLHFETCYYQGIDYCLRHGLRVFEPGAQGEHKLARGFLPVFTHSKHWVARADFSAALKRWCDAEASSIRRYAIQLAAQTPFSHHLRDDVGHVDQSATSVE